MERCYYCNSVIDFGDWDGTLDTTNPITYLCGSTIVGNVFDQTEECERLEKIANENRATIKQSEYIDMMKAIDETLPVLESLQHKRDDIPTPDPKRKAVYDLFDKVSQLNDMTEILDKDPKVIQVRQKIEEAMKKNKKSTLQEAQDQILSFNHGNRN